MTKSSNRLNNLSDLPEVFLSEPASFRLTGSGYFHIGGPNGQDDVWVDALYYAPDHGTLFPLHDVCLATSCRGIEHHQSRKEDYNRKPALEILAGLLSTSFIQRQQQDGSDGTVKDIFHLSTSCSTYGPRSVLALSGLDHWDGGYEVSSSTLCPEHTSNTPQKFYTNPIEQADTNAFVQRILESSPRTKSESKFVQIPSRTHREIECLPKELLDVVCSYLPVPSVIALHQTSKLLALQIPLDANFWQNTLGDGSLHPHIWDLDTKCIEKQLPRPEVTPFDPMTAWDWRSVAKLLATKHFPINGCDDRLVDMPDGFWNRCRIWAIVEEVLREGVFG